MQRTDPGNLASILDGIRVVAQKNHAIPNHERGILLAEKLPPLSGNALRRPSRGVKKMKQTRVTTRHQAECSHDRTYSIAIKAGHDSHKHYDEPDESSLS